jgi:hypothetical protein
MTAEWVLTAQVKVNKRYTVEIAAGPGGMTCAWSPDVPDPKRLSARAMKRYRAGRDALLAQVAERMGGKVLVIE